jgi:hypothetical protein
MTNTCQQSRGFVLPFVILLAVVASVFAVVMLQREGAQRRTVARLVRDYEAHHMGRGIREIVGGWVRSLTGQPLDEMVEADGHALDLRLPDGMMIQIYVRDAQGRLVADLAALPAGDREWAARFIDELAMDPEVETWPAADDPLTRTVGPAAVSLQTAPEPVLAAIARAISGNNKVGRFVEEIVKAREAGPLTDADLNTAAGRIDMTAEQRAVLTRFVTIKPELYELRANVIPRSGARQVPTRYEGLFFLPKNESSNRGTFGGFQPMGPFLSWNQVRAE